MGYESEKRPGAPDAICKNDAVAAPPGMARTLLDAVIAAVFVAVGMTAVDGVIAVYAGSFVPWSVAGMVAAFWAAAAAAAAAVLTLVAWPALSRIKRPARAAIVPAVVLTAGFVLHALIMRVPIGGKDSLGKEVLLNAGFIAAWGAVLGILYAALASRSGASAWMTATACAAGMLLCAGLSYFVRDNASAFVLVVAPAGAMAIGGIVLERARGGWRRAASLAAYVAVCAAALVATARTAGIAPMKAIDEGFRAEPAKVANLAGKPNVIIITLDTVRADHTSLCGYRYKTTPNLDKFAAECRFFPYGESVDSWTLPAHASLFTGKYPREHGARGTTVPLVQPKNKPTRFEIPLAPSQVTLASLLSMKGYNTAGIAANYVYLARTYGLAQGFSYYLDTPRWLIFVKGKSPVYTYGMEAVDRMLGKNGKLLQTFWSGKDVTCMAADWIGENKDTPFFLFLNYMDAHCPYSAEPPFDRVGAPDAPYDMNLRLKPWQDTLTQYVRDGKGLSDSLLKSAIRQYDGSIAYMDYWVERLFDALKREGLYDDTLIIVTSDHGEFFGEHQLLSHGTGLYEGGLRIPILVKYPGGRYAGEVLNERVSIMDIYATVLETLGLGVPEVSAVALGTRARGPVIAEEYEYGMNVRRFGPRFAGDRSAIYKEGYKYVKSTVAPGELYNLTTDEAEEKDLSGDESAVALQLDGDITTWQANTSLFDGTTETTQTISPEEYDRLKSLGYLGN